jgi:hypothetical protein
MMYTGCTQGGGSINSKGNVLTGLIPTLWAGGAGASLYDLVVKAWYVSKNYLFFKK